MKKKFLVSAGAGLVALMVAIPLALAHGPRGGGPDGERGPRIERMAEKLGLDDKQKASVKVLFDKHKDDAQSLREQIRAAREKVKTAWLDKSATEASVKAAQREVQALETQLSDSRVTLGFGLKKVLTPAQFEQVATKLFDGHKGFGKRHFKGGKGKGFDKRGFGKRGGPPVDADE